MPLVDVRVGDLRVADASAPTAAGVRAAINSAGRRGERTVVLPATGPADLVIPAAASALDPPDRTMHRVRTVRFLCADEATAEAWLAVRDALPWTARPVRREDVRREVVSLDPRLTRRLPYERRLDRDEAVEVRAGIAAPDMDHRWLAWVEGDVLRLARSWTGQEIFRLRLRPDPDPDRTGGALLDRLDVIDDPARYRADDAAALREASGLVEAMADGRL